MYSHGLPLGVTKMGTGKNIVRRSAAAVLLPVFLSIAAACSAFDNSRLFEDAESGDREAQYTLAHQYLKGRGGVPKDRGSAVSWFEKSADAGHRDAAFDLAIILLETDQPGRSRSQAFYRMQQAAENGHVEAQYMLGMAHWKSEPEAAAGWLIKAAESGHRRAAAKLEQLCTKDPLLPPCNGDNQENSAGTK